MINIDTHCYNKRHKRNEPKFKIWRYAGIMLTYKCTASCALCYYNCSPQSGGLISIQNAIDIWQGLIDLAGGNARVHLTGGEPFLYYDLVKDILRLADKNSLTPLDSLETNGYWAVDDKIVESRLIELDRMGMERLKVSWDPFHAEYIPESNIRRLVDIGSRVLGDSRLQVRWGSYLQQAVNISDLDEKQKIGMFIKAMGDYPVRITGRAAEKLGDAVADKTVEEISDKTCKNSFLSAKGIHVDPYGNVFSGLCSGIVIGNINDKSLVEIWQKFDPENSDITGTLFRHGPVGLLDQAVMLGYKTRDFYAGKCHLCTDIRQFFFDNGMYKLIINPAECYIQKRG